MVASGSSAFQPAALPSVLVGSARAQSDLKPQAARLKVAAEPASPLMRRAQTAAPLAKSADSTPAGKLPVQLVLAAPEMTPGPRTTALTSDIKDVMRRPASAWDYADALPSEVTGYGAVNQSKAGAKPMPATQPAPSSLAAAAPKPLGAGSAVADTRR